MKRKLLTLAISALLCFSIAGCAESIEEHRLYTRYQRIFYDTLDTFIVVLGYAQNQAEFEQWMEIVHSELHRLHMLFDIHNNYDGINNLKTINDNAGISPVEVDSAIIDLLEFAKSAYSDSGGSVNVALGSVLSIWHRYRQEGMVSPQTAALPSMELLSAAMEHTQISYMIIDRQQSTVFLKDDGMSLDAGALAKGFALQRAVDAAREHGFSSGLINGGGDIIVVGAPMSERDHWIVGVNNPMAASAYGQTSAPYDALILSGDMAVATSGGYQRYFVVSGRRYSHIIDPATLLPADRYLSVTVVHPDINIAEMLSTAAFILPLEQGVELVERHNAQAIWILNDGSSAMTAGYSAISQNF